MAITESAETQPGRGEPPASGPPRSRARTRWRRWTPGTLVALAAGALVVLAVLAWTYQPVEFGDEGGVLFPASPRPSASATSTRSAARWGRSTRPRNPVSSRSWRPSRTPGRRP